MRRDFEEFKRCEGRRGFIVLERDINKVSFVKLAELFEISNCRARQIYQGTKGRTNRFLKCGIWQNIKGPMQRIRIKSDVYKEFKDHYDSVMIEK